MMQQRKLSVSSRDLLVRGVAGHIEHVKPVQPSSGPERSMLGGRQVAVSRPSPGLPAAASRQPEQELEDEPEK
eukprot:15408556-Alexandrium_andersonii.AAC.1